MNPIPIQFINTLKKLFSLDYFKQYSRVICIEDLDGILTQINDPESSSDDPKILIHSTQIF